MENEKMKIFESTKLMAIAALVAFFAAIAEFVVFRAIMESKDVQNIFYLGLGAAAFFLWRAYKKHDKNVMKGLLGVILTLALCNELCYLYGYYQIKLSLIVEKTPVLGTAFGAIEFVFIALQVLIFLGHFFINADHHSTPALVHLNQVCLVMLLAVIVVQEVFSMAALGGYGTAELFGQIFWCLLELGVFTTVICIESKLDAFRIAREQKA